ncbi:TraC family protein [Microvirga puerhi]|uniref:TraC family protein n=1 Tax=Microvirga puerhi TaxID=2876078 RepID=A0ABS7VVE6_9HYPH|nr:TraC family protein [Microvirga puerhi]MBZ6078848.1 TraC family protein [Microvirga puerhi]
MARTASRDSLIKQRKEAEERFKREKERIEREIRRIEDEERLRFGRLAEKAGVLDIEIPDDAIIEALKAVADRFRGSAQKPVREAPTPAPAEGSADAA